MRRYPIQGLNGLAERINQQAHTGPASVCYQNRDIASVDMFTSRVVVHEPLAFALDPADVEMVAGGKGRFIAMACDSA